MAGKPVAVQTPLADVKGKTAFVTGGSSGIGLGIARVLSAAGMKVAFTYKSEKHRDAALASFPADNPGVHAILLDTTDRDGMVRAADETERRFGNVHLVVNNAGVGFPGLLSQVSWEDWDWAMNVNVNGVFNGVRTFLPRIRAHGEGGHFVVTSSSAGLLAGVLGVYVTSKFAVVGMHEALREELAGSNIGVSIYCPGLVRTDIFDVERNRPVAAGAARKPAAPPQLGAGDHPPVDLMGVAMDPMEAARQVLEGIRRNDLYILSHPEWAPWVLERSALLMDSFSAKPAPKGRRDVSATFAPTIYRAELAKRGRIGAAGAKAGKPARKAAKKAAKSAKKAAAKKTARRIASKPAKRRAQAARPARGGGRRR